MRTVQALWMTVAEEKRRAAFLMSQTVNDIDAQRAHFQIAKDGGGSQTGVSVMTPHPGISVKTVVYSARVKWKKRGFLELSARKSALLSVSSSTSLLGGTTASHEVSPVKSLLCKSQKRTNLPFALTLNSAH